MQITFERLWSYRLWMFFDRNPDNAAGYSTKQAFQYVIFHFKTQDFSCFRQWIPDSTALGSGSYSLRTDHFKCSVSNFYCLRVSQWRHWHQRTQFVDVVKQQIVKGLSPYSSKATTPADENLSDLKCSQTKFSFIHVPLDLNFAENIWDNLNTQLSKITVYRQFKGLVWLNWTPPSSPCLPLKM